MADHIWKEEGNRLLLWDKVKIIDEKKHWKRRRLKEAAYMVGHGDVLIWFLCLMTYQPLYVI